jgi:ATP-dependent Clp protease ATP-binding subunit ClpC
LTDLARQQRVGFLVGHDESYKSMVNILSREEKNNALLIGETGVGKGSIIEHLAFQVVRDEVPQKLFDRRVIELNIPAVTAGAKTPGEIQARFERLASEVLLAGNIILSMPDIHNLRLTSEGINAFETLEPIFSASLIPVVGTTTPQEYRKIIEPDPNFRTLFDSVKVEELSGVKAAEFLTYQSYLLEAKWNIIISYQAIKRAVALAQRFLREKPLPVSALDLLGEALAEAKRQNIDVLEEEAVGNVVARKVKVPVGVAREEEAEKLLKLEEKIHQRLVNQEEAVKAVASAMRQYRAGLSREKGPIATFLFIGPTGVGKTELAKALTGIYFGSENEMVRFDMSEYQDPKSIWNFVGSPDGSVKGNLTEAIKAKPFSVLLLDEFEKAHYDILELFLPLFDEGKLSDSLGTTVDFSNTIIVCTSNAHSELIKQEIEKGTHIGEISALLKKRLSEYFKPELVNRFDDIIVFRPLTPSEIERIASLNLRDLARRLEDEQGITLSFDPEVAAKVAELGWDPVFGARPLRGVIREQIREALAQEILKQNIRRGDKVSVTVQNGAFALEKR